MVTGSYKKSTFVKYFAFIISVYRFHPKDIVEQNLNHRSNKKQKVVSIRPKQPKIFDFLTKDTRWRRNTNIPETSKKQLS